MKRLRLMSRSELANRIREVLPPGSHARCLDGGTVRVLGVFVFGLDLGFPFNALVIRVVDYPGKRRVTHLAITERMVGTRLRHYASRVSPPWAKWIDGGSICDLDGRVITRMRKRAYESLHSAEKTHQDSMQQPR